MPLAAARPPDSEDVSTQIELDLGSIFELGLLESDSFDSDPVAADFESELDLDSESESDVNFEYVVLPDSFSSVVGLLVILSVFVADELEYDLLSPPLLTLLEALPPRELLLTPIPGSGIFETPAIYSEIQIL